MEQLTFEENEERLFGRGTRQRKEVNYSEELTEKEWLKAVEDGNLEETQEAKRTRKKRKQDTGDDSKVCVCGCGCVGVHVCVCVCVCVMFMYLTATSQPKKRRTSSSASSPKLTEALVQLWEKLADHRDGDGRQTSSIFMVLPTRKELPHYYQVIKKPVDLKKIKVWLPLPLKHDTILMI